MPGPRCWRICWGGWPGAFPGGETRQCCGQMVHGLLMELEDHNCWTIAEAAGHRGPHRLQHFLSRAVWDDQQVLEIASAWAAGHLDDGEAVLIAAETADEKSSADAAGQYSGTVGGIALCQVADTLTCASGRGHALTGRALYLPEACAADEEHRELASVPEQVMFVSKLGTGRLHCRHPRSSRPRLRPACPRTDRRMPGSARQRAVAPAHPRGTRRPIRKARIPAEVLLGPASHRVRLLPAVLAPLRDPPGVELPAQRRLRRPRRA
jgi:DDE superfamily endonuclease